MSNKIIIIILLVLVCLAGAFYLYREDMVLIGPIACTQEAKLCPDGTAVSRTGPNCEFTECPVTQTKEGTVAALNQKILNGGVFITPLEVISDSRCPVDVQCIWAGEVSLKVRLEKGTVSKEVVLKLQTPFTFEENKISLTDITPAKNTKRLFTKEDYRFTFLVTPVTPLPVEKTGIISGIVTTSPTCPVERIPPDPGCAPKPYATSINIREEGKQIIIKTIQSNNLGVFKTDLPVGSYELDAITANGSILPRCNKVTVLVKLGQTTTADISCDTGIR